MLLFTRSSIEQGKQLFSTGLLDSKAVKLTMLTSLVSILVGAIIDQRTQSNARWKQKRPASSPIHWTGDRTIAVFFVGECRGKNRFCAKTVSGAARRRRQPASSVPGGSGVVASGAALLNEWPLIVQWRPT
ncbi:hypothetical protein ETC03_09245 [Geobacillus sp. MMMUD3]|nr:hypothetical protein [Geobacillus sp. MMMUD3]